MIHFGTSGWRSLIAEDFTFANVRKVVQAIATYLKGSLASERPSEPRAPNPERRVVVGYDTRFLSPEFAKVAAEVLVENGIHVLFSKDFVPTPVVSFHVLHRKAIGAINFTASHNPPEYNGIKFNTANGAPAAIEVTQEIERLANTESPSQPITPSPLVGEGGDEGAQKGYTTPHPNPLPQGERGFHEIREDRLGRIVSFNPRLAYLARLRKLIDASALKKARMAVGVDVLYGTGRGYLDTFLREAGCRTSVLHAWRDVQFGGQSPEPAAPQLAELVRRMRKEKWVAGFSTDGDADRFGVVDQDGTLLSPNEILPLVLQHLVKTRGWKGFVVRSVMTSHFMDAVARYYQLAVKETPVGFKYIAQAMQDPDFLIGGEESGGLTIRGHVPEKDGILACLLMGEIRAVEKRSFRQILQALRRQVGPYLSKRINLHLTDDSMEGVRRRLEALTPNTLEGLSVKKLVRIDGFKFVFQDDSWLGIRLSGTEPVVRLYLEADTSAKLKNLEKIGKKLIQL